VWTSGCHAWQTRTLPYSSAPRLLLGTGTGTGYYDEILPS
jgi:hypothetical protein